MGYNKLSSFISNVYDLVNQAKRKGLEPSKLIFGQHEYRMMNDYIEDCRKYLVTKDIGNTDKKKKMGDIYILGLPVKKSSAKNKFVVE